MVGEGGLLKLGGRDELCGGGELRLRKSLAEKSVEDGGKELEGCEEEGLLEGEQGERSIERRVKADAIEGVA